MSVITTSVATRLRSMDIGLSDRIRTSKSVYYSPEINNDGEVYYRLITEADLVQELIKEDKKGEASDSYSLKEVRQRLRANLGLKI